MSKKSNQYYVCDNCGYESPVWFGRCPSCKSWNSAVSYKVPKKNERSEEFQKEEVKSIALDKINGGEGYRYRTGLDELDRVLGGGIVPGSVTLLSGEPGIGKSTLVLQLSDKISKNMNILYVTGEESLRQIKLRADRLGLRNKSRIDVITSTNIDFLEDTDVEKYALIIFDSLQTLKHPEVASLPGSVVQVRECTNYIVGIAKKTDVPVFIVGHITKGGQIAGPKLIEHLVDTVLYFETNKTGFRFIRTIKNRFGPADEVAVFEMKSGGLDEIKDISTIFLDDFSSAPGNIITAVNEGSKIFLIEVQSLVSKPIYGNPRRLSSGISLDRVLLTSAVLTRRAKLPLDSMDIYVNVVGGIQITDPGVDLAVAASLISAFLDKSLEQGTAAFGEIGLDGSIRSVSFSERRVERLKASGFKDIWFPDSGEISNIRELAKVIGGKS
ncbi:MAG: DNA repair protein RadA [Kosmotoga sp.]|nr:MAG: DNA repair protein RadA [Kosmotoga sp.]